MGVLTEGSDQNLLVHEAGSLEIPHHILVLKSTRFGKTRIGEAGNNGKKEKLYLITCSYS